MGKRDERFADEVRGVLGGAGFAPMDTAPAVAYGVGFNVKEVQHTAAVNVWAMVPREVTAEDEPAYEERCRLHRRYKAVLEAAGYGVRVDEGEGPRVRSIPETTRPYQYLTVTPPARRRSRR